MPISNNLLRAETNGNGSTTVFAVPGVCFDDAEVVVTLFDTATNTPSTQTLGVHYTLDKTPIVNNNGFTANVVFVTPPATGKKIIRQVVPSFLQEILYEEDGDFPSSSHNEGLDRSARRAQFLNQLLGRTISMPLDKPGTYGFSLPYPLLPGRALVINSSADGIDQTVGDFVTIEANVKTVADNIDSVNAVAAIDSDVTVVAANIADVQDAEENAAAALVSKNEAASSAAAALASASSATINAALASQYADAAQAAAGSALVDVITLGCVGDGVTNDLPALQTALAAGWRNFYIPDNCNVNCNGSLLLSYLNGSTPVRYSGVTFKGANTSTSKLSFSNHGSSYQSDADMPVGIGAYFTAAGTEGSGSGLLTFENLSILGPKYGCAMFIASSSHITFWNSKLATNSSNEAGSDRCKYLVWMKDCIRVHAYNTRFSAAYIAQWCNGARGVTGRATVAANAVYNDDFAWIGCQFYGTSYAAIIDAGSGSEATRTIQACDFSNAERYYGYIGNKGITLDYSQSWDEFGYKKIWLTDTNGASGIMPYQYRGTKIANVVDPDTMNFNDFFIGGWASGATIQNNHFYNGLTNMDLTGCYGSALVSGNNYRMNTDPTGGGAVPDNKTVHLYTGQTCNGKIKYLGDYRVFGSVDREIVDFNSVVETELNGQTSQTVSSTTYWTGYNYKSNPMGGIQVNAGTGGTRPSSFTVKAKIHLSTINPMIRLAGLLCSGTVKAKLHMGAGAPGTPYGYQEVLFNLNQNSSGKWQIQYVRTQDQHLQNSFYSLSQNPLMFFGMINNTSTITDQTALFIGVKGNATNSSAILELEFNCGFVTNRSGTYYRLHPKIDYSNEASAAAEILAAETAVAGSTTALTDCKTYLNTFTWNPGSLADGAAEVKSGITLTGAVVGDYVVVVPPYSLQGIMHSAHVSATDTVTCVLYNKTGGTIDLANSTGWKVINKGQ